MDTMQEIRDRLTTLETKHEERHYQVQGTLSRIATAVESIADNQNRMQHLGAKVDRLEKITDDDHDLINRLVVRQTIMWKVISGVGMTAAVAAFKSWGGI